MVQDRFHPPPTPSTPELAPWEAVRALTQRLDKLIGLMEKPMAVGAPSFVGIAGAPGTTEQLITIMAAQAPEILGNSSIIPFQKEIPTAYQDEQDRQVPFDGMVRDVVMGFPAGCQQLMEVRLMYYPAGGSYGYIIPTIDDSFIALDDFTAMFSPRFLIKRPGNLRVEWWNYDSLNVHTVPVIATVVPTGLEIKK